MKDGIIRRGSLILEPPQMRGGGFTTNVEIANDNWMVARNDTGTGGIRGPNDVEWKQLLRFGDNLDGALWKQVINGVPSIWEVDIAETNSNIIRCHAYGFMLKSSDRAASWQIDMNFKGGVYQPTIDTIGGVPNGPRLGGKRMAFDPANPLRIGMGDPIDGLYYTLDGGATPWLLNASLPVPRSTFIDAGDNNAIKPIRRGLKIAFDRSSTAGGNTNTVFVHVDGYGTYKSTTGLGGNFVLIGGPIGAQCMDAANGKICVTGAGDNSTQDFWFYNGATWSQPTCASNGTPVYGACVAFRPGFPNTILVYTGGGGVFWTTDGGVTWEDFLNVNNPSTYTAPEAPWIENATPAFLAVCNITWHSTLNRVYLAYGLGVIQFDNPPRTGPTQKYTDISGGIDQMLFIGAKLTPRRRLLMPAHDRPLWVADLTSKKKIDHYGPDGSNPSIRHGGGMDYAIDDPIWLVGTEADDITKGLAISANEGETWTGSPVWPYKLGGDTNNPQHHVQGGNVAVSNKNNIVWLGTYGTGMVTTINGGQSWMHPTFLDANNNPVSMIDAKAHDAYWMAKQVLFADKLTPGRFLFYCVGSANAAQQGVWESLDGGLIWRRTRVGVMPGQTFYHYKMKPVPKAGYLNHLWFVEGNLGNGVGNLSGSLRFSPDKGATETLMPGWQMVYDVTFGKADPDGSNPYPRAYASGWRGDVEAIYQSDDFNPANPAAMTWQLRRSFPAGRVGPFILEADMTTFDWLAVVPESGGYYIDRHQHKLLFS